MIERRIINRFSEKKFSFWDKKMGNPNNSGSAGRIFSKFCTMKGDNR